MTETVIGDFYKPDFDIDEFLNTQNQCNDLKEILELLQNMKKENTSMMTTVIRDKTDSVILIAEQLQSLYKKIENFQSPLSQLKEEIKILTDRVKSVSDIYDQSIQSSQDICTVKENLTAIKAYKLILVHIQNQIKEDNVLNLDFSGLERLICKYAYQAYVITKLNIKDDCPTKNSVEISIRKLLRKALLNAHTTKDVDKIIRVLDMFVYLNMTDVLKEIICDDIVKPKLLPIFCDENLKACGGNLDLVYGQALAILQTELKSLIDTAKTESIDIDIILDCYWNVADKLLRANLTSITAAGHPDAFFKYFNSTHKYLKDIGNIHGNPELYRENATFIEHVKRFNLLVYYEIRHQHVSSAFEATILKCSQFADAKELEVITRPIYESYHLKIKVSVVLDLLIDYLFCDKVFIGIISEQFVKSAFLLTSRYATWIRQCLMKSITTYPKSQEVVVVITRLINDLKILKEKLCDQQLQLDPAIDGNIHEAIAASFRKQFEELHSEVADYLIRCNLDKMRDDLRNVSDIPRLYRKTNRNTPSKASSYVSDAFKDLARLTLLSAKNDGGQIVTFGEEHKGIVHELLTSSTKEYKAMVGGVLNAVSKTEESLKRLKSRNVASSDSSGLQGSSDEAKIRLQIKLDVEEFVKHVKGLTVGELDAQLEELLQQIDINS